jgi:hypothetical protein
MSELRRSSANPMIQTVLTIVLHSSVMGEIHLRVKYECKQKYVVHACTISCKLIVQVVRFTIEMKRIRQFFVTLDFT